MWLGKKIASRQKEAERPVAGTISGEQNGGLLLQSSSEYREVAAAGPYGVKSLPPAGENAVGVVSGEKTFCLGVEIDQRLAAGRAGSVFLRRSENHPDPGWENPAGGPGVY